MENPLYNYNNIFLNSALARDWDMDAAFEQLINQLMYNSIIYTRKGPGHYDTIQLRKNVTMQDLEILTNKINRVYRYLFNNELQDQTDEMIEEIQTLLL